MGLNLSGIYRLITVLLFLGLLSACGGGSSGGGDSFTGGGFVGSEEIKVNISAQRGTLPPSNVFIPFPNPSNDPYTTVITVTVTLEDRPYNLGESSMSLAITGGLNHGSLVCPEIEGAEGPCTDYEENANGDSVPVGQFRYRGISSGGDGPPVGLNSGVFQFFFTAEGDPDGTAIITATVTDPNTGQGVADSVQIRITEGISTGDPAQITFSPATPAPLYIIGQGLSESLPFRITVVDDALEPVDNPGGRNNLLLQILPNSPNGGEVLSAIDADGQTRTGRTVSTRTLNGLAQATFTSGNLPGTAVIAATADRFDNNVDNGVQSAVTDIYTVSIGRGQPRTLTFTGPFVEIIAGNDNILGNSTASQAGTAITDPDTGEVIGFIGPDNVYTIPVTVLAIDEFGNPPPANTQITFRVVDSPLVGFPDQGRGEFVIRGDDGNIQEGGVLFTTPPGGSTFNGAQPNCQLVYEGNPPDQEGGRIISSVNSSRQLAVNTPFNEAPDTGFTIPYVVGCAPHVGSVGQFGSGEAVAFTDTNGTATMDLIYDATQLGRRFKLVAEASGGQAGAVLSYWYLGVGNGILNLLADNGEFITDSAETIQVDVGGSDSETYIIRLTDDNSLPLPSQLLSITVDLVDPDADLVAQRLIDVQNAEVALTVAQDTLDRYIEAFPNACGVVTGPVVGDDCSSIVPVPSQLTCGSTDPVNLPDENVVLSNSVLGGVCPLPPVIGLSCSEAESDSCTTVTTLADNVSAAEQTLFNAQTSLAEAEALDALYNPVATINGTEIGADESFEVTTGVNGETPPLIFSVSDLPPQRNGGELPSATFLITTVGPNSQAPTLQVIFQVPGTVVATDTGG